MHPTPHAGTKLTDLARQCQDHCMGPDGPGGAIKSQVDRWSGAFALGWKVVTIALVLLTASVTISIAAAPSLVRSAVSQVVPGLVEASVSAALRRHGIVGQEQSAKTDVIAQIPSTPWLIPQAHAETTKGVSP